MKITHVYYDRRMTNEKVRDIASGIIGFKLTPLYERITQRTVKLWAHIIRAGDDDLLKRVTIGNEAGERLRYGKRRAGRLREQWCETVEKAAWDSPDPVLKGTEDEYTGCIEQREFLVRAAIERCL